MPCLFEHFEMPPYLHDPLKLVILILSRPVIRQKMHIQYRHLPLVYCIQLSIVYSPSKSVIKVIRSGFPLQCQFVECLESIECENCLRVLESCRNPMGTENLWLKCGVCGCYVMLSPHNNWPIIIKTAFGIPFPHLFWKHCCLLFNRFCCSCCICDSNWAKF